MPSTYKALAYIRLAKMEQMKERKRDGMERGEIEVNTAKYTCMVTGQREGCNGWSSWLPDLDLPHPHPRFLPPFTELCFSPILFPCLASTLSTNATLPHNDPLCIGDSSAFCADQSGASYRAARTTSPHSASDSIRAQDLK